MSTKELLLKKEEKLNALLRALTEKDPTSSFVTKLNNEVSLLTLKSANSSLSNLMRRKLRQQAPSKQTQNTSLAMLNDSLE